MWGCFLMSGVKILHFLKDWWKSIPIHQNYTFKKSENRQVTRFTILTFPIDYCVRINGQPERLFSGDIQS